MGDQNEFLMQSYIYLAYQLGLMLVGTLLISLLVGWLAAMTLRPVRQVIDGMEKLGQGDLTARIPQVPAQSKNEVHVLFNRSEERRVGKECVSTCRSRWSPYH